MYKAFTPLAMKNLTVKNRFVRSATHEGMADPENGFMTPEIQDILVNLARHQVGLIITGHAYVSIEGKAGRNQFSAATQAAVDSGKTMLEQVHKLGGKVILQLAHAGAYAPNDQALAPSPFTVNSRTAAQITPEQIADLTQKFANSAKWAENAGYDGVQIHAAHGYLLSEFLSTHYNHRTDAYGGSTANCARMVYEVLTAVRQAVSPDFPVLIKINADNFLPDNYAETVAEILQNCAKLGLDMVELSGGVPDTPAKLGSVRSGDITDAMPVYYQQHAAELKKTVPLPLILTGGIRSLTKTEELLQNNVADMVSLSRPLIREPELIERWANGQVERAKCISCNACFRPMLVGKGLLCVLEQKN